MLGLPWHEGLGTGSERPATSSPWKAGGRKVPVPREPSEPPGGWADASLTQVQPSCLLRTPFTSAVREFLLIFPSFFLQFTQLLFPKCLVLDTNHLCLHFLKNTLSKHFFPSA